MNEHTKEPWRVELSWITGSDGKRITCPTACMSRDDDENEANERRIVACVNACAGVATEELEQSGFVAGLVERLEDAPRCRVACATLAAEVRKLRASLREHAKWADKAAMVLATLEAESSDEEEQIQAIIDGISTWAPDALMGPNRY